MKDIGVDQIDLEIVYNLERMPEEYRKQYLDIFESLTKGELDQAESKCRDVLNEYDDKDTGMFHILLADICSSRHDRAGMKKYLNEVIDTIPAGADTAHVNLARAFFEEGDTPAAERLMEQVGSVDGCTLCDLYILESDIALEDNEPDRAKEILDDGIREFQSKKLSPASESFIVQTCLLQHLKIDVEEYDYEEFAYDADRLMEYLRNKPSERDAVAILKWVLDQFDVDSDIFADPDFRGKLLEILQVIEQAGTSDCSGNKEAFNTLYMMLEINEAQDASDADEVFLQFCMIPHLENEKPYMHAVLNWAASKRLRKRPDVFQHMMQTYPHLMNSRQEDIQRMQENPDAFEAEAEQEIIALGEYNDRESARQFLQRMTDFYEEDYYMWVTTDLSRYEEELRDTVIQAFFGYRRESYEIAEESAEYVLDMMQKPDEAMQYILVCNALEEENMRKANQYLRRMKRDFPNALRTKIAEGKLLAEQGKAKRAERILTPLIPCELEVDDLFVSAVDALSDLDRESEVRGLILKQLDRMTQHPLQYRYDQAFLYYGRLLCAISDISLKQEKNLKEDLEAEKEILSGHVLNRMEEDLTGRVITEFCTAAMDSEWARDAFIEFIKWCSDNHVFATQSYLVESAYAAYESYRAFDDDNTSPELYELVSMLNDEDFAEGIDRFEILWRGAEELRINPEGWDDMKEHYPNFIKDAASMVEKILEDTELAKHSAEDMLAMLTGMEPTEIRKELNESMGNIGSETDRKLN